MHFKQLEKPTPGKLSGVRKTPAETQPNATRSNTTNSGVKQPTTSSTNPPESYNKHLGNMAFYFCERCGRRLSEVDLAQGLAKNKKLKGVYCEPCSDGVSTIEMDAVSLNELQCISWNRASLKNPEHVSKLTKRPASLSHPSRAPKKERTSRLKWIPLILVPSMMLIFLILSSNYKDDSKSKIESSKLTVTPEQSIIANQKIGKSEIKETQTPPIPQLIAESVALEKKVEQETTSTRAEEVGPHNALQNKIEKQEVIIVNPRIPKFDTYEKDAFAYWDGESKRVHVHGCRRLAKDPKELEKLTKMTLAEAEKKGLPLCSKCPAYTASGGVSNNTEAIRENTK